MTSWTEWRATARPITSGHLRVATYERGPADAPSFTFCHGYPSASVDIAEVADLLREQRLLLTLDLPGFGASAKPPGHAYSIHAAADAVEALWADRAVEQTTLVAHDYSVSVAQELLARDAEGTLAVELDGAVLMNGGLYPELHRPTVGQQLLLDPDHGAEIAAAVDRDTFRQGIEVTWGRRRPFADAPVDTIFDSMDEGGGTRSMHELLHYVADRRQHADRWRAALESTEVPLTFVWGDLDPVSGGHVMERLRERLPASDLRPLADVGHWPLLEAPDEVAAAILAHPA